MTSADIEAFVYTFEPHLHLAIIAFNQAIDIAARHESVTVNSHKQIFEFFLEFAQSFIHDDFTFAVTDSDVFLIGLKIPDIGDLDELEPEELDWVRRGRNACGRGPRRGDPSVYGRASGFETMVGWLYLNHPERLQQLFHHLDLG